MFGSLHFIAIIFVLFVLIFNPNSIDLVFILSSAVCMFLALCGPLLTTATSSA